MPEETPLPGDQEITKLFGFPGFEAVIKTMLKYINELRAEHSRDPVTYEAFKNEILAETNSITESTPK